MSATQRRHAPCSIALVALLAIFLVPRPSLAGWSPSGLVAETYTNAGWTLVKLQSGSVHNPAACAKTGYYGLNSNAGNYKGLLASLLASQLSGRQVILYIHDSLCGGQNSEYPMISSVRVLS